MWDDGKELAAYDYNADGTIRSLTHGPVRQEYAYDPDKNLTGLRVQSGEELLVDNQYLYDGNGNRTHKKQLGGETLYHYDPLNQVKKVEYPGYTEELFYDKAGNRTRRIAHGVEELYQYDPRNRLTAYTKNGVTTPFRYDNAGNLLVDDKARYTYDAFNRTVKVETFDGNVQVNRYDAEGLRHEMEENGNLVRFIFNPDREAVTEEDNTGLIRLVRATELIARSTDAVRTYYHYASDEMGSTTHIVDEAGNVQNRYEYDAWGNLTAQEEAVPNRFKYTGQQFDPITQQYYLRARFYNPVIARFTQEDTYRGDGLNLYAYCANNPVFYVDPTGHVSQCVKDAYEQAIRDGKTKEQAYRAAFDAAVNSNKSKVEAYKQAKEVYNSDVYNLNKPIPDVPEDGSMTRAEWERTYSQLRAASNYPGKLTSLGKDTWISDGGLIYGKDPTKKFDNYVQHVLDHTNEIPKYPKKEHSVYNIPRTSVIAMVDEAWSRRNTARVEHQGKTKTAYYVPMGREVGTDGQRTLRLVVRKEGEDHYYVVTAFPDNNKKKK